MAQSKQMATIITPTTLPPEILVKLFHKLELPSLLTVGDVCRQWRAAQRTACEDIRSLHLCIGQGAEALRVGDRRLFIPPYEPEPLSSTDCEQHRLYWAGDYLDDKLCAGMGSFLRNVTDLEITLELPCINALLNIVELLSFWEKSLLSLSLSIRNSLELMTIGELTTIQTRVGWLMEQLNVLVKLRQLTLITHNRVGNLSIQKIMPLIAQLDEFRFHSPNSELTLTLLNHLIGTDLERLRLSGVNYWRDIVPIKAAIAARIVQLNFTHRHELIGTDSSLLDLLNTGAFHSLTWLSIRLGPRLSLAQFAGNLTKLPHLTHLTVGINFRTAQHSPQRPSQISEPLSWLKVLTLDVITKHSSDLNATPFGCLFPYLHTFTLIDRQQPSTSGTDFRQWPQPEPPVQHTIDFLNIMPVVWATRKRFLPYQIDNEDLKQHKWNSISRIVEHEEADFPEQFKQNGDVELEMHEPANDAERNDAIQEEEMDEQLPIAAPAMGDDDIHREEEHEPPPMFNLRDHLLGIGRLLMGRLSRVELDNLETLYRNYGGGNNNFANLFRGLLHPIMMQQYLGEQHDRALQGEEEEGGGGNPPRPSSPVPPQFYEQPNRRAAFMRRYLAPLVQCWELKRIHVHEATEQNGWHISTVPVHTYTLADL